MELIITEKNDAAGNIAKLLADGAPKADKVYDTPVYRFKRNGEECVIIGLRGHILEVEFPQELVWSKKSGWVGLTADGEALDAPELPRSLPTPPWEKKRKPYTAEGIDLKGWKIQALPYLTFAPLVKAPKEKGIIRSLRNLAKKADSVVIATDFDREGELIGLDALNVVLEQNPDLKVSRARYSAFIKKEIQEAFSAEKLVGLDYDLAHAGESRQHIDLIWGAVLTRYLTVVKYSGIGNVRSAGRVQTPTLALVVEKEKERQAFVPEDYWVISGTFAPQGSSEESFIGNHVKGRFKVEAEANAAFEHIKDAKTGTVASVEKKRRKVTVPAPFNTTSLQAAASGVGLRPSRTMRIAESLYMSGLISYPRVDNTVYPDGLDHADILKTLTKNPYYTEHAQQIIASSKSGGFHPTRGKQFSTDHPPIYPTGLGDPDKLRPEEWKLYNLIARRYMATLMDPAVVEGTTVRMDVNGEELSAKGDVLVVPGFRAVYPYGMKKDEQMPALEQGQVLDFSEPKLEAKQTEPPARYSSGRLVQEMEKRGLGTKATRADMIEKLYGRKYIVNDPIEPTMLGFAVIDALERFAPAITTPDMTAELEQEMTNIADGKAQRDDVVNHSRRLLGEVMEDLIPRKDEMAEAITEAVIADSRVGSCPKCGGDLCVKTSAKTRGSFVGCNNWPDCDVTYPLPQGRYDVVEEPCPVCGGAQIKVTPFRSKAYNHCLDPECKSNQEPSVDVGECPVCKAASREGRLVAQKNPRTLKRFIRCSNHPECENSYPLPQRGKLQATGEVCDACGAPEVIVDNGRGPWRICVNMDCPKREEEAAKKVARKSAKGTKGAAKKTAAKKPAAKKTAKKSTKKS